MVDRRNVSLHRCQPELSLALYLRRELLLFFSFSHVQSVLFGLCVRLALTVVTQNDRVFMDVIP